MPLRHVTPQTESHSVIQIKWMAIWAEDSDDFCHMHEKKDGGYGFIKWRAMNTDTLDILLPETLQ